MSEEALRQFGGLSETMSDLYALKQLLFESNIEPKCYYLERIEGGFQRPSFLIKLVNWQLIPRNDAISWVEESFMIQYFSEEMFDAQNTAYQVMELLAQRHVGQKDLLLPRYDFSVEPPQAIPISFRDDDGNPSLQARMGTRIDPTSVSLAPIQEDDDRWNVAITFTAMSPRLSGRPKQPVIESVVPTRIGPPFVNPTQIAEAGVNSTVETDLET